MVWLVNGDLGGNKDLGYKQKRLSVSICTQDRVGELNIYNYNYNYNQIIIPI
jgi:hypothetical protein